MGPIATDDSPKTSDSGQQAIVAAFEVARDRGRPDWYEMSIAVLKNRILDVTNRQFRESEYGVETFGEFLALYPEIVEVDGSRRPPRARLSGVNVSDLAEQHETLAARGGHWTIRPDLWRAVVDYASGTRYEWIDGRAVPVEGEAAVERSDRSLPTIRPEEVQRWREQYVQLLPSPVRDAFESQLVRWRDVTHATGGLPMQLRGRWTSYFKVQVLARLEEWFRDANTNAPDDLVDRTSARPQPRSTSSVDELRRLVSRYVDEMTEDELVGLHIPLSVLSRVHRSDG